MTQMTQMFRRRGVRAVVVGLALIVAAAIVLVPPAPVGVPALVPAGPRREGRITFTPTAPTAADRSTTLPPRPRVPASQFIIVTDHGDGMRPPDAPQYRHGVLVIDAVELNTTNGHLVALGLPATPYPFAGTAADVLEDVRRLGGFGDCRPS